MPSVLSSLSASRFSTLFHRFLKSRLRQPRLAAACGAVALTLCGGGSAAWAQAKPVTSTTLAVTSGGSAVTTVASGNVVTLTATVNAGSTAVTTGQVNFCDASAAYCTDIHILGTAQLTSAGTAVLKFRPGIGSHSYKAVFAGTNAYAGSSSGAGSLAVTGTASVLASATTIAETGSFGAYTLSATVTEAGSTVPPTGTVSFLDTSNGSSVLDTAALGTSVAGISWPNPLANATSGEVQAVAVGDFNGDGIPDIAMSSGGGNPLEILLGNTNGTYTVAPATVIPGYVYEFEPIIVADFNGDGKLDLALLDYYANTVEILLGNGDGTFTATASSPSVGYWPTQLAVGDFNGDGIPDLAVTNNNASTLTILLGNGDGTFNATPSSPSVGSTPKSIVAGDFNGDGKADLAVSDSYDDTITILLGNGDGTFAAGTSVHSGSNGGPIAVGDFNGDGKLDLAVGIQGASGASDSVAILTGNGDGTFALTPAGLAVSSSSIDSIQVGDFNADGIPDLVLTNAYAGTFTVFLGSGSGSFAATTASLPTAFNGQVTSAVGDFNGDGRSDVVVGTPYAENVSIYTTEPTETATVTASISSMSPGPHLVDAGYGGDGNYNSSTSGTIQLWGVPQGTATTLTVAAAGSPVTTVAAGTVVTLTATVTEGTNPVTAGPVNFCDASANLCTDIHLLGTAALTGNGTATFKFVPGPGAHSYKAMFVESGYGLGSSSAASALTVGPAKSVAFSDTTAISMAGSPGAYSLTATVAGIGGAPPPTGTVSFLDTSFANASLGIATLGASTQGAGWLLSQTSALGTDPVAEVTGDFNGDGIPDLAVLLSPYGYGYPSYSVGIFFGNGDGTFTAGPASQLSISSEIQPVMIAGDFNGDGKTDLALLISANLTASSVTTLLGNGDGTFAAPLSSTAFNQGITGGDVTGAGLLAADFNGDGKLDLAVMGACVNNCGTTILLGNGDGTFKVGPNPGATQSFTSIATGDFNGDGIPDLLSDANGGTVYLGKGDGTFIQWSTLLSETTGPGSALVADFNGDGVLDLAITDDFGVEIFLGKGDGTFAKTSGSPITVSSPLGFLVAGDFNHDGKLDIAGLESYYGQIALLAGGGDGTFTLAPAGPVLSMPGYGTYAMVAADFNEDGVPDLALLNGDSNTASILLTEPTQTVTATVNGVAPIGAGTHNVQASYTGDSNYPSSTSGTVQLLAGLTPVVISPAPGTYTSAQTITLSESIPGATIYYYAFGIVNTKGYVPYTAPIQINEGGSEYIEAYATETGYQPSSNVTASFTFNLPAAPLPTFSPVAGSYATAQTVTISDAAPGATIYYTTNGSWPGVNSPQYTGPIKVSSSGVLAATAIAPGYSISAPATAQYLIGSSSTSFIYTFAGNGEPGYSGDGGPATAGGVNEPNATVLDGAGNLYIADTYNNVVREVAAGTGVITTVAGNGTAGYSGDSGPATSAELNYPFGLAVDSGGNLFISDSSNNAIRKVAAGTGVITTVVGNGLAGYNGDNIAAVSAQLSYPGGIALDKAGNLYIADQENWRIRKVAAATGVITTVAGIGQYGNTGDGGPAISATFMNPTGLAVDSAGDLYIADSNGNVVREVYAGSGKISTVAGTYSGNPYYNPSGYSGDGGPATSALLNQPFGVAVDGAGNLYIADSNNGAIRKVSATNSIASPSGFITGIITTVAGNGNLFGCSSLSGDAGAATSASLCYPRGVTTDSAGNLYIAETSESRIREVTVASAPPTTATAAPVFSVPAGTYFNPQTVTLSDATPGAAIYVSMTGDPATTLWPGYNGPINVTGTIMVSAVAVAPGMLPSTPVTASYTITSPPTAVISTVAGNGVSGTSGAGGPATSAEFAYLRGMAIDSAGNIYLADSNAFVVWEISAKTGNIAIVAGNGTPGSSGDGGPAVNAELESPSGIAVDKAGNVYIADTQTNSIRKVTAATGVISTVAGARNLYGIPGGKGDGGLATLAFLNQPAGLALDSAGNLYIADTYDYVVRKVTASTGIISTFAGNWAYGYGGDGGPATSAKLNTPFALAFDSAGNLFVGDEYGGRIRKVAAGTGVISTVAGNGDEFGTSGDGGLAINAEIFPQGLAVDAAGNVYISSWPGSVREVSASTGNIARVVGNGYAGFSGDGGSATVAAILNPQGLAFDAAGNLYIADAGNSRVRKVTFPGPAATPAFSVAAGTYTSVQTVAITDSTPGAAIYYSADGTTPTTASSLYSAPISVGATETLQAIAIATGYTESPLATAAYTINLPVTPTITWPVPSAITYGTALSATQLDATTTAAGTFTYTPAAGAVLGAGTQALSASFTPTDPTAYTTATAGVNLVVNPAAPTLSLTCAEAGYDGNPHNCSGSASGLSGATVAGTWSYSPASETSAGSYPVTGTFTSTDPNYLNGTASATLKIDKAVPAITWPKPAAVSYGTALSSTQLNATASVSGAFVYNPAAGTVPAAGNDTLSVTFTPTDATDFTTATATVTLVVNPVNPIPTITSLTPALTSAGSGAFSLTVNGGGFVSGSTVYWGTTALTTQYVSATQLTASVTAALVASAGTGVLTVQTPAPGGGTSNSLQFEVDTAGTGTGTAPVFASTTASVAAGSTATYTVTLPSGATNVSVSCLNAPSGVTCSYSAGMVSIATSSTTPKGSYQIIAVFSETLPGAASSLILLPFLLLPLLFLRRKMAGRGIWVASCLGLVLLAGAAAVVGCGGGGSTATTTTNPTHQVSSSGAVTLTIQ